MLLLVNTTAENNFSVKLNPVGKTFKPRDFVCVPPKSALIKMWVFDKKFVIQKRLEVDVY